MEESRVKIRRDTPSSLEAMLDTMLADYGRMGDLPSAVALRQAIRKADPAANVELESQRDNLAATVRSLIYQIRRKDPGNHLAGRAMAYLTTKGLQGSILREDGGDTEAFDTWRCHRNGLVRKPCVGCDCEHASVAMLIWYDDASVPPEMFSGHGAEDAAYSRYEQISTSWNAHLFVRINANSRDAAVEMLSGPVMQHWHSAVAATVRCFDALPSNSPAREASLKINGLRALIGSIPTDYKPTTVDWGKPLRYLTDDRDMRERHELVIMHASNGDWYVSVLPEGHAIGPTVRLCTSGGASSYAPGLTVAVSQAYRALDMMRKGL